MGCYKVSTFFLIELVLKKVIFFLTSIVKYQQIDGIFKKSTTVAIVTTVVNLILVFRNYIPKA